MSVNKYLKEMGARHVDSVTPQSLSEGWKKRREHNHGVHDLSKTLFSAMNKEEQAEVIVDHFCLIHKRRPEMERFMISTHK